MRVIGSDVPREAFDAPQRILEPVPAGYLHDEWDIVAGALTAVVQNRPPSHPGWAPVLAGEHRHGRANPAYQLRGRQNGAHRVRRQLLVLGGKRVDGWRDDGDLGLVQPLGMIRPGEHVGVCGAHVGNQKAPRPAPQIVRQGQFHVTAPDHRRTGSPHRIHQPRGLRIVQHHHVTLPDQLHEFGCAGSQPALVPIVVCA